MGLNYDFLPGLYVPLLHGLREYLRLEAPGHDERGRLHRRQVVVLGLVQRRAASVQEHLGRGGVWKKMKEWPR